MENLSLILEFTYFGQFWLNGVIKEILVNLENLDNFKVNMGSVINFTFRPLNFSNQTFCGT